MAKVVLDSVTSGYDLSKVNANFQKIEDELNDKVLYRDNPIGETNTLITDVDANGVSIYNLPTPTLAHQAVPKSYADTVITEASGYADDAAASAAAALVSEGNAANSASDAAQSAIDATNNGAAQVALATTQANNAANSASAALASANAAAASATSLPNAVTAGSNKILTTNPSGDGWDYDAIPTGLVKGDGSALSAVVSGTDVKTINGSSILGSGDLTVTTDLAATINAATSKATPVDNDELGLVDSAASNALKKLTWSNLKATLKAYFDTLYTTLATVVATANNWTASQRSAPITDNDGSFDLSGAGNNYHCTPTGSITLTFTNIASNSGKEGIVMVYNSSNYAVSLHSNTKAPSGMATLLSATGDYKVGYYCDGANVHITCAGKSQ